MESCGKGCVERARGEHIKQREGYERGGMEELMCIT